MLLLLPLPLLLNIHFSRLPTGISARHFQVQLVSSAQSRGGARCVGCNETYPNGMRQQQQQLTEILLSSALNLLCLCELLARAQHTGYSRTLGALDGHTNKSQLASAYLLSISWLD